MKTDIFSGTIANVLAGIILAMLSLLLLDEKKVLRPWVYQKFNSRANKIIEYFFKFLKILVNPWLRVALIVVLVILINYWGSSILYSALIVIISITLFTKQKNQLKSNPAPDVSDSFEKISESVWITRTGSPAVEQDFGKPAPDLGLSMATPIEATNSFLLLKDDAYEEGVIECDINLEPGSVFNIVFFCNPEKDNWYMARYDSRLPDSSDGFLIKDQGKGVNWRFHSMSGTHTPAKDWCRARVEFSSEKVRMYRNGELIAQVINPIKTPGIFGTSIGFFNEVNHVHVDNFYISKQAIK